MATPTEEKLAYGKAALLAAASTISRFKNSYPEAVNFFLNQLMNITPDRAVWALQIVKTEARIEQHRLDCLVCQASLTPHCPVILGLHSRIRIYRERLENLKPREK